MPLRFEDIHVYHGEPADNHQNQRRQSADCANGGFYRSPAAGQTIPSSSKMTISWDPSCIESNPKQVDIYLLAPFAAKPEIFRWKKVDYHTGKLDVDLIPKSWNNSATVNLQLNIVEADLPPFLSSLPPGPVFQATYDASAAASAGKPAPTEDTSTPFTPYVTVDNSYKPGGLSKGGLAAAVLFPLLAIFAAVAVYVRWTRTKEAKKRQRWSQAVDKRMSTISGDWKSISAAGASAAVRQSMAAGDRNTRGSSFFAGNGPYVGRPSSTFGGEGNRAGVGASTAEGEEPDMSQFRRPRMSTAASGARVSRVSFAADLPRPSMGGESLRQSVYSQHQPGVPSRAFHRSGDEVPPLPTRTTYYEESPSSPNNPSYNMSPTQTEGPQTLTPDAIRSRIANGRYGDGEERPSVDGEFRSEVLQMPAMSLMRTGGNASDDYLISANAANVDPYPALPSPRVSVPPLPLSNANGNKPAAYTSGMMPLSDASTTLSPDAMLRAYAAKRSTLKGPTSPIGPPQQMRTLYAPSEDDVSEAYGSDAYGSDAYSIKRASVAVGARNPNRLTVEVGSNNPFRTSMAPSVMYSEYSRYSTVGTPGQNTGYDVGKAA